MVIVHDCIYSCSIFVEAVFVRGGLAGCFRRFGRLSDGCLMFDGISLWGGFLVLEVMQRLVCILIVL